MLICLSLAYDSVDRVILWKKLKKMGFEGKFLASLQKLYEVTVTVNVNEIW